MTEQVRKYFLNHIFSRVIAGKDFRSEKKIQSFKNAKEEYIRICSIIRLAFTSTVMVIDNSHQKEILDTITFHEKQINFSNDFNELDQLMIAFQTNVIFLLLGYFPKTQTDLITRIPLQKKYWTLNNLREVQFIQSCSQKVALILQRINSKKENENFEDNIEFKIYELKFKKDDVLFLQWFKQKYPDIYLELF